MDVLVSDIFLETSMDYSTKTVTLVFPDNGYDPTEEDVREYVKRNYGFVPTKIEISLPYTYKGMENPGIATAR